MTIALLDSPAESPALVALDRDGDGELSADELQTAVEALKQLDKNSDGRLTPDELGVGQRARTSRR